MEKFYLGLDIGVESVGVACTDEQYNLLRAKGKDLWAVRLFDQAKKADERRTKRTARRRLQRRRQRINFLQDVFAPFMEDKTFFLRLNNSGFCEEDKNAELKTKFSLFADMGYTDADFYRDFVTIFHLREALIKGTDKKIDLRHYYLALHHIIKYRGHFLFEGESISAERNIQGLFATFNDCVRDLALEADLLLPLEKAEEFRTLAKERKGLNDKKRECIALFGASKGEKKEWISLLLGGTGAPKKMFGEEYAEHYKEIKSIQFKGLTDENFEARREDFEEEHFDLLCAARDIYNFIVFDKVLGGKDYISEAMVAVYEKHKSDLARLKKFVKGNYPLDVYQKIFRSSSETANYVNYVGYNISKNGRVAVEKCKTDEFYKFLKKVLESYNGKDKAIYDEILAEIREETFLPKILHSDNGLFPHQINGLELDKILENLCKQYPAFAQKDEDGYTPAEKIKKIFLFRVPYYVGPLNPHGKNAWIQRKEGATGKITPWNFDELVDKAKSNEGFIRRMTNKCTYLRGEDVLPKGSMYYQAFDVLNQINKLTVSKEPISIALKQEIFQNVYLKQKKVGAKQIKEYLVASGYCTQAESREILGGFDAPTDLKASMSSYVTFKEKFGDLVDNRPDVFENIIFWHTLNTDKGLVEELIKEKYSDIPAVQENIKWLKGLTAFKDFGRLSLKLLYGLYGGADVATGEAYTILNRLYHTNDNFNQLLFSDEYNFREAIDQENTGMGTAEVTYDDVENLYVSPMVRRGVWQALKMTDEYVQAIGKTPDKIFIEVTRQDGKKGDEGRTVSRKRKILELYNGAAADCQDIDALRSELNREDMTDSKLRSERYYLYFMQLGRCAYTGEMIHLEELGSDLYDVDHIIPQSMTKDDSLDNKVLVKRKKNAEKSNVYPLPQGFTDQQGFWRLLRKKDLMSAEKYARLTRTSPLTDADFKGFLNYQLTATNQTVKAVAELLKRKYGELGTKIVYSKAKNVSDFKQISKIVKCRETNDLHHARDAYLNIVVGNIFDTKFTSNASYFYADDEGVQRGYNLEKIFYWRIKGAWAGAADIDRVKKIAAKTSMQVTRYAFTNQGAFYDETVYGKEVGAIAAPRKNSFPYNQTDKYGGFKSLTTAYFAVVSSKDKNGSEMKTIEAIPVLVDYRIKNGECTMLEFLQGKGLVEPVVLVEKLKVKSLVSVNGYRVWLSGITGQYIILHNAQQWFTDGDTDLYIKQLVKLVEKERQGKLSEAEKNQNEIPLLTNRKGATLYATKERNLALYQAIVQKLGKKAYQGLLSAETFRKKLEGKTALFENLTTFEQVKVLLQIVRFMKCNAECADLKLLNDGATCGKLLINKNITDVEFSIIHQSPCGLVERIQKL